MGVRTLPRVSGLSLRRHGCPGSPRPGSPRALRAGVGCDAFGYARGWQAVIAKGQRVLSHGGYAGTAYIRWIDSGLSLIVLTNREDSQEAFSPYAFGWEAAHIVDAKVPANGYRCWE